MLFTYDLNGTFGLSGDLNDFSDSGARAGISSLICIAFGVPDAKIHTNIVQSRIV